MRCEAAAVPEAMTYAGVVVVHLHGSRRVIVTDYRVGCGEKALSGRWEFG